MNEPARARGPLDAWREVLRRLLVSLQRATRDRQSVSALLGRFSGHLAALAMALVLALVSGATLTPQDVVESAATQLGTPFPEDLSTRAPEILADDVLDAAYEVGRPRGVVRRAEPLTTIPERVRLHVITYTVQEGDNVFWIAEKFKLSPYTIVWSNMETLQGAPWLLQPGLTLAIPPVDGVYHTVMAGETPEGIAEKFQVDVSALYNQWNDIEPGQPLAEGTLLVIPGGVGEDFDWNPPPPEPSAPAVGTASGSWGYCGDTAVAGYGANGWFILPTGSYEVSGWTFHDPRNPRHIGLDYRCYLGDPIYASDAGVVVWAGWNGGYGNLVRVRHGNGYETYYAHLSAYAVSCGDPVSQGQVIGYCGSTGWSTGPHLHYEIRLNGVPQDPKLFEP